VGSVEQASAVGQQVEHSDGDRDKDDRRVAAPVEDDGGVPVRSDHLAQVREQPSRASLLPMSELDFGVRPLTV